MKNLINNASFSAQGTVHQFYVALDKCFDLLDGESLYIETYGDVTVPNEYQTEVKLVRDSLTENNENFWKTLRNWMAPGFSPHDYKTLILLTTQKISSSSMLFDWNTKKLPDKRHILSSAFERYEKKQKKNADIYKYMKDVLDDAQSEKLSVILDKFVIADDAPDTQTLYKKIFESRVMGIPVNKRKEVVDSLFGFILSKNLGNGKGWKITYTDFSQALTNLTSCYSSRTFKFPRVEVGPWKDVDFNTRYFVTKIEEIDYKEVIHKAIEDVLRTRSTISKILGDYSVTKDDVNNFSDNLKDEFERLYQSRSRKVGESNQIALSKDFYDEMTIERQSKKLFPEADETPPYFRCGSLHELLDDERYDLRWLLKK